MRIPRLRQLCRHPKKWTLRHIFQAFFLGVLSVLLLVAILAYFLSYSSSSNSLNSYDKNNQELSHYRQYQRNHALRRHSSGRRHKRKKKLFKILPWNSLPIKTLGSLQQKESQQNQIIAKKSWRSKCSLFNCFDILRSRCGKDGQLSVYLYPLFVWEVDGIPLNTGLSKQFLQIIDAIRRSKYFVEDPEDACIFVPTIDTLSLTEKDNQRLLVALKALEFWGDNGQNHLIISMFNSSFLTTNTEAIIASSDFPVDLYRPGFHVPLLTPNSILLNKSPEFLLSPFVKNVSDYFRNKDFIAIIPGGKESRPFLLEDNSNNILVLDYCKYKKPLNYLEMCKGKRVFPYPQVLNFVDFCILYRGFRSSLLWEVMSVGCIPVIVGDFHRLPFDEMIDWKRHSILLYEHQLGQTSSILASVSQKRRTRLKTQVEFIFNKYFKSMGHMTGTLLEVIQDRLFSHHAKTLEHWNHNPAFDKSQQPLFNPVISPSEPGFTAVILAYERVPSLFQVIQRLADVPSLAKILVVWNNQIKPPPPYSSWPKISKPVKVIKMSHNKMSNRFYPFDEIETEAVFSLDDDIIMLTVDEVEFGFQTWREFPDRIVGFPSRSHVWDNGTQRWKYESEWTNEISMVLTGASFYHKYWHQAYTHELSRDIRDFVDSKMNCEDIAMNFLVAARTGQPPIKVTPRKKFKCPTCSTSEMLSSDTSHMIERTDCINRFAQVYGYMPLISAEFRADPVLYKFDNLSKRLKKFNDIGSL